MGMVLDVVGDDLVARVGESRGGVRFKVDANAVVIVRHHDAGRRLFKAEWILRDFNA